MGFDIETFKRERDAALFSMDKEVLLAYCRKYGVPIPDPSPAISPDDNDGCIVSPVTIFPDLVRNEMRNRRVKTNVAIPSWLKELAEANDVNYSRLLEVSLIEYLNVQPQN